MSSWDMRRVLLERPTLGRLLELGDENYRLLLKLAPDLRTLTGGRWAGVGEGVELRLEVLEQTPYSSLVRLTHFFEHEGRCESEPAALLRVYYDARQVEVVSIEGWSRGVARKGSQPLAVKWQLSLFLSKWIAYLLGPDACLDGKPRARLTACREA